MERYKILEGEHRSGWYLRPFINRTVMHGEFQFNEDCLYSRDLSDQINKLCGFCFLHHHFQSIRIGWRPNRMDTDKPEERRTGRYLIELFMYYYSNGVRHWKKIHDVVVGKRFRFTLRMESGILSATISNGGARTLAEPLYWDVKRRNITLRWQEPEAKLKHDLSGKPYHPYAGYLLFPYFGGQMPAIRDMTIALEYDLK